MKIIKLLDKIDHLLQNNPKKIRPVIRVLKKLKRIIQADEYQELLDYCGDILNPEAPYMLPANFNIIYKLKEKYNLTKKGK